MSQTEIQYISDEGGHTVAVIVPIELWRVARQRQVVVIVVGVDNPRSAESPRGKLPNVGDD